MREDRPTSSHIVGASFANVRRAVALARDGVATQLEANAGMSVDQAQRYARSLLRDGGPLVGLRVDGIWLHVEPLM